MDVALLFLGEDENGLHALEEGGDGAAAQELGASGLIALGGVGPVVDRPAAFKGGGRPSACVFLPDFPESAEGVPAFDFEASPEEAPGAVFRSARHS